MKFWLQIITVLIIVWSKPVLSDDTNSQTNASGSNTNITGGYTTTNIIRTLPEAQTTQRVQRITTQRVQRIIILKFHHRQQMPPHTQV